MVGPLPPVVRPWPRPPVALILNKADKLETGLRATVLEAVERGLVAAAAGAKAGPCSSGAGKSGAGGSSADAAAGMGVQKAVPGGAAVAGGQRDAFKGGRFARVLRTSALLGQGIGDVRQLLLHKVRQGSTRLGVQDRLGLPKLWVWGKNPVEVAHVAGLYAGHNIAPRFAHTLGALLQLTRL